MPPLPRASCVWVLVLLFVGVHCQPTSDTIEDVFFRHRKSPPPPPPQNAQPLFAPSSTPPSLPLQGLPPSPFPSPPPAGYPPQPSPPFPPVSPSPPSPSLPPEVPKSSPSILPALPSPVSLLLPGSPIPQSSPTLSPTPPSRPSSPLSVSPRPPVPKGSTRSPRPPSPPPRLTRSPRPPSPPPRLSQTLRQPPRSPTRPPLLPSSPSSPPPSLPAPPPPSPPPSPPVEPSSPQGPVQPVQYYIHFGKCGHYLQQERWGSWVMIRPLSQQHGPDSLVLYLDTKNVHPVAATFGTIDPPDFPMRYIYFAYFTNRGVQAWSPALDSIPYKETPSYYSIRVNGRTLSMVRDLKDNGVLTPTTSVYSLKGSLNGDVITPSSTLYKIEIVKACRNVTACARIPNPDTVFTSPSGHIVWSIWNVGQTVWVNGMRVRDHAWCPVQKAVNVP